MDYSLLVQVEKTAQKITDAQEAFLITNQHWPQLLNFYTSLLEEEHPKKREYLLGKATALFHLHRFDEARTILEDLHFDFPNKVSSLLNEITKLSPPENSHDEEELIVPLKVRNGSLFATVRLNGRVRAELLIDTGASMVHLSPRILKQLGIGEQDKVDERTFITAGGRIKSPIYLLDKMELERAEVGGLEVSVFLPGESGGFSGILGMNFLKYFNWSVDLTKKELILRGRSMGK